MVLVVLVVLVVLAVLAVLVLLAVLAVLVVLKAAAVNQLVAKDHFESRVPMASYYR